MRAGLLISFMLWAAIFAVYVLVSGCSTVVPSMKYCDEIDYQRRGSEIVILARCTTRPSMGVVQ